jgi:hypothetical protein
MGLISGEIHYVCEICSCDNLDKPMIVHCDSKQLSTLTNITFNTTIETLTLINNSLTFKSGRLKIRLLSSIIIISFSS